MEREVRIVASSANDSDREQCQAIAVYTSQRCQHDALPGLPYCADHFEMMDIDESVFTD
ncbi:hypothetical protein SAMN05216388_10722 [Halorientalis persicus]|uniref:GcrA cell cycle regulator n=1 Tax=Halorientalis persicus TaxID=1367881 RepID=A0A1H8WRQ7_9EURY|nr:hypothetical protein SAMN05216388_10722 [Halorientalis persicus]